MTTLAEIRARAAADEARAQATEARGLIATRTVSQQDRAWLLGHVDELEAANEALRQAVRDLRAARPVWGETP